MDATHGGSRSATLICRLWTELRLLKNGEVEMHDSQSSNGANAPVGSEVMALTLPPTDDDAGLLILEVQFDRLITKLLAAQKASGELAICPDQRSLVRDNLPAGVEAMPDHDAGTEQVEAILA